MWNVVFELKNSQRRIVSVDCFELWWLFKHSSVVVITLKIENYGFWGGYHAKCAEFRIGRHNVEPKSMQISISTSNCPDFAAYHLDHGKLQTLECECKLIGDRIIRGWLNDSVIYRHCCVATSDQLHTFGYRNGSMYFIMKTEDGKFYIITDPSTSMCQSQLARQTEAVSSLKDLMKQLRFAQTRKDVQSIVEI
jgi:hypothetical protein